jgi:hypothetical protein
VASGAGVRRSPSPDESSGNPPGRCRSRQPRRHSPLQSGPDGSQVLMFGPHVDGGVEMVDDFWRE